MLVILLYLIVFFFNDTATTEIYTLSLHDALPIYGDGGSQRGRLSRSPGCHAWGGWYARVQCRAPLGYRKRRSGGHRRSEEHTSELQSRQYLVCRLLLEKKKKKRAIEISHKEYTPL